MKERSGPTLYWKLMREAGEDGFTCLDIQIYSGAGSQNTVRKYVNFLVAQNAIAFVDNVKSPKNSKAAKRYRVILESLQAPMPKHPNRAANYGRQTKQMWVALRALRNFSLNELAASASTEECVVELSNAYAYIGALISVGAVIALKPVVRTGNRWKAGVYRLKPSANTGPKPLFVERKAGIRVYDPNRDVYYGEARRAA